MGKAIVITGAAGFIGRNVVAELNARGCDDLLLVDTLGKDDKWRNLPGLRFEDLLQPADFLRHLEAGRFSDLEGIVHLGACSSTTENDADFLLENNYAYSRRVCEWSLSHQTRFVYASSAATYGDGSAGYSDDVRLLGGLKPLNMYGYSKHLFDLWADKQGYFNRIAGLKYFNVYGAFEDHKGDMRSMVNKAYGQIKKSGKVQLFKSHRPDFADGEQLRDFVYVKDAVAVTLYLLENRAVSGLFNCGTGEARSWNALVKATFAAMNLPLEIEFVAMPEILRGKYQYFTQAEMAKLRVAGYTLPFVSLEDGVRDYVTTYLQNREGVA